MWQFRSWTIYHELMLRSLMWHPIYSNAPGLKLISKYTKVKIIPYLFIYSTFSTFYNNYQQWLFKYINIFIGKRANPFQTRPTAWSPSLPPWPTLWQSLHLKHTMVKHGIEKGPRELVENGNNGNSGYTIYLQYPCYIYYYISIYYCILLYYNNY